MKTPKRMFTFIAMLLFVAVGFASANGPPTTEDFAPIAYALDGEFDHSVATTDNVMVKEAIDIDVGYVVTGNISKAERKFHFGEAEINLNAGDDILFSVTMDPQWILFRDGYVDLSADRYKPDSRDAEPVHNRRL